MNYLAHVRRHLLLHSQLVSVAQRSLYIKDKDLDKKNYKPSEQDQLENYIKNYLQDDPKAMSEQDKQKLLEEFKKMQ